MKKRIVILISALSVLLLAASVFTLTVFAEEEESPKLVATVPFEVTEEDLVIEKPKAQPKTEDLASKFLTLDKDVTSWFTASSIKRIKDHFNRIYPVLCEEFNYGVMWDIEYGIDSSNPAYVAYQIGGSRETQKIIKMNTDHFKKTASDFSTLSHELTHAVQCYRDAKYGPNNSANGGEWLTEGVADYSRFLLEPTPFSLPEFNQSQSYTDSYRVTARFFVWLDQQYDTTFMEQFNEALKTEVYTQTIFVKITGKTLDELWAIYAASDHKVTRK
ncbi:MAG: hypothetical protein IKC63_08200 [Clostridia bacterium]|nr:hypothetical protein [Clostridia bacterium]